MERDSIYMTLKYHTGKYNFRKYKISLNCLYKNGRFQNEYLNASVLLFILLELQGLGEPSSDDGVRKAGQLGRVETMGLGTGSVHELVQESDRLLGDVLVALVLHHAGHVSGEHVLGLLQVQAVVVGGKQGSTATFSQGCHNGTSNGSSIYSKNKIKNK